MKKHLLAPLLVLAASLSYLPVKADPFWYDTVTNYVAAGGSTGFCITTNNTPGYGSPQWIAHLPGAGLDAIIVTNSPATVAVASGRKLSLFQSGTEYIHRWFDPVATNGFGLNNNGTTLYASFILNVNQLPINGGTYFAHFMGVLAPGATTDSFMYRGRIFVVANTNSYPFTNTVPGTYRLGVANGANDTAQGQGPTAIVPLDLATNTDYLVVLRYNPDDGNATLWINPTSETDTTSFAGPITDFGPITNDVAAFAFRQRVNMGRELVRNIAVGTNFYDVTTNSLYTNSIPLIGLEPGNITNYSGNPGLVEVGATGIGLSYQWYQIVAGPVTNAVSGATGPQLYFSDLEALNAGQYFCTITNANGATNTTLANVVINSTPTAPGFTVQPASTNVSIGGKVTLSCTAFGTGPLSYQWNFNGMAISDGSNPFGFPADSVVISGSQTPTLTLTLVSTNEAGDYTVTVTGSVPPPATSSTAHMTVNPVRQVSIGFLRSLEDTTTWQPTDTASVFGITGTITTFTNLTSGTTASYYIQDSTAGINLFVTGDSTFRPTLGDVVKAVGTLSIFNQNLELAVDSQNTYQSYAIVGHTNLLPAPYVFGDFTQTNNAGFMETNMEGRLVMLTNVYFSSFIPTNIGSGSIDLIVTNKAGMPFDVRVTSQIDQDLRGRINSRFAWNITGVMVQFLNSATYANKTYELTPSRLGDFVTNAPSPVTANIAVSGTDAVLTWQAVPYLTNYDMPGAYSYSVYVATDLNGPYAPLATGLTFNTTNGIYVDGSSNVFSAVLAGANENPPNASTAFGEGFVVVTPDQSAIIANESWSGLTASATISHIHGPATTSQNASVYYGFTGVPSATSGSIPQQTFAVTNSVPLGILRSNLFYMNVHDNNFPAGEIRGQLYPATTKFYKVSSP